MDIEEKYNTGNPRPIPENIGEYFKYDPCTGSLTWKIKTIRRDVGEVAGNISKNGYRQVGFNKKRFKCHRICYFIYYKKQPLIIDHINGDRSDNRIKNLRSCTNAQNIMNTGLRSHNTSGVTGVSLNKKLNKWVATIQLNRKEIHIGIFKDKKDAIKARKKAEVEYFGDFKPLEGKS